jgi:hypothetical protein
MKDGGFEGVIFRRLDAGYIQKRSSNLLKYKFRHDADCVVTALGTKGKANMALGLMSCGSLVDVGECSALTGDQHRIRVGDVVTVTYLYASSDRRLVQPTKPRLRRDKDPADCTIDQLFYPTKTVAT